MVYVGGILNPDNINCSGNLEAFAGSFTSLTVNGRVIDGSSSNNYTPPYNMLKLVRTTGNTVTMETEGGQRFTIYATIGG